MKIIAPAKINIGLEVVGKQENGYHRVEMIMQSVSLSDVLNVDYHKDCAGADEKIVIKCNRRYVPTDSRNLVYKAAEYMINEYNIPGSFEIYIKKNIPVAAGLAGGSTDCAAIIKAINKLCNLKLNTQQMMELGLKFGADVPYCIHGGAMLAQGLGEKLTPITGLNKKWIVISKPYAFLSTGKVYEGLNFKPQTAEELDQQTALNPMKNIMNAMKNDDMDELNKCMFNRLESVSEKLEPRISQIKNLMKSSKGCKAAMMSGSGPSVFGIYDSEENARASADAIRRTLRIRETYVCHTLN